MKPDFSYYLVTGVDSRRNNVAPWCLQADDIVGQICYIGYLQPGEHAFLNVILRNDPTRFRPLRTSTVADYQETPDGSVMHLETQNRVYHLRRATSEEIEAGLSKLRQRPMTVPIRSGGQYGT